MVQPNERYWLHPSLKIDSSQGAEMKFLLALTNI